MIRCTIIIIVDSDYRTKIDGKFRHTRKSCDTSELPEVNPIQISIESNSRGSRLTRRECARLEECVANSLGQRYRRSKMPVDLTEVVFSDYEKIIGHEGNWPLFAVAFGQDEGQRARTLSRLRRTRLLRNHVFHFKRRLNERDQKRLADCGAPA